MRRSLFSAFLLLAGCDNTPSEPAWQQCDVWIECEHALQLETKVNATAFPTQRPGTLLPGDSIIVTVSAINRASIVSDTFNVYYFAPGLEAGELRSVALRPGERFQRTDTLRVSGYTFGVPTTLGVNAYVTQSYQDLVILRTGDVHLPIAPSGYILETVLLPPQITFRHDSHTDTGPRVRHKTTMAVLTRVSNPYNVDVAPMRLGTCFFDYDHCFAQHESATMTPVIKPGASEYFEYQIPIDTKGHYFEWWSQRPFTFTVCAEAAFSDARQCTWYALLIIANFEAECTVTTASLGATIVDDTPDCGYGKNGSAHRFEARKGERYRAALESGSGDIFLSGPDGVSIYDPRSPELTIPSDGSYYVVIRHTGAVRFRLDRL